MLRLPPSSLFFISGDSLDSWSLSTVANCSVPLLLEQVYGVQFYNSISKFESYEHVLLALFWLGSCFSKIDTGLMIYAWPCTFLFGWGFDSQINLHMTFYIILNLVVEIQYVEVHAGHSDILWPCFGTFLSILHLYHPYKSMCLGLGTWWYQVNWLMCSIYITVHKNGLHTCPRDDAQRR